MLEKLKKSDNQQFSKLLSRFLLACCLMGLSSEIFARKSTREISFSWQSIEGASAYQLKFSKKTESGFEKIDPIFKTAENKWKGDLPPGNYQFELRALDGRGVPGKWSPPTPIDIKHLPLEISSPKKDEEIITKRSKTSKVEFEWDLAENADHYKIDIFNEAGDLVTTKELKTNRVVIPLPVATKYKASVIAVDQIGKIGDQMEEALNFTLIGRKLKRPKTVIKTKEVTDTAEWTKPEYTETFSLTVSYSKIEPAKKKKRRNKKKKKKLKEGEEPAEWKVVRIEEAFTETTFELDGLDFGFYKLEIIAKSPLRQDSKKKTYRFEYKNPENIEEVVNIGPFNGSVSYTYKPTFQVFNLIADPVETDLKIIMLSSNKFSTDYWIADKTFGFNAGVHRIASKLFENPEPFDSGELQNTLSLTYMHYEGGATYRLKLGALAVDMNLGIISKTVYTFEQASAQTIDSRRNTSLEIDVGIKFNLNLGRTYTSLGYKYFKPVSSSGFEIESSNRANLALDFSHYILNYIFLMTYGLEIDSSQYRYGTSEKEISETATISNSALNIGISWLY